MGINIFPSGGVKFDKTAMNQLISIGSTASINSSGWVTPVNITGKGYLDQFAVYSYDIPGGTGIYNQIRITVDGVVKVLTGGSNTATAFLNRQSSNVAYNSAQALPFAIPYVNVSNLSAFFPLTGGSHATYPDTAGNKQAVISADSIYFNSSLLIEVKAGAGQTGTAYMTYFGGYI